MLPGTLHSQAQPIRFRQMSLSQGLSQATVNCIVQDSRGFLWVGTEDGLNRFDGQGFVVYKNNSQDPESLPGDAIWSIAEDDQGDLWIASEGGGIARWNHETDRFTRFQLPEPEVEGASPRAVRTLFLDSKGRVWIGTRADGLWRLDPATGKLDSFRHNESDPSSLVGDAVFVITSAGDERLWVGTETGLDLFDPQSETFEHFQHDPAISTSLSDNRIRALLVDREGHLWVGTYGGGVNHLLPAGDGFEVFRHEPDDPGSLAHDRIRTLYEDRAGRLWAGTAGGLSLLDVRSGRFQNYHHDPSDPSSLADSDVMAVFQDRGGVLFFGTRSAGLHWWHPQAWSFGHVSPEEGLSHGTITGFAEDRGGNLWVATLGGGLNLLDRDSGEVRHFRPDPDDASSIGSDFLSSLLLDAAGVLWVGSLDNGLYQYDADTSRFRSYLHDPADPQSLGAEGVTSLLEDSRGAVWVGTFGGGLNAFDPATGVFTHHTDGLDSPRVICLAEGQDALIWMGTDAGGLSAFHRSTKEIRNFRHDPQDATSLGADTVFSLYASPEGHLWVGTREAGLAKLETFSFKDGTASFRHYSEAQGLANDVIYGIQPDDTGLLWLSTNHGLSAFDPETESFRNFDVAHGLQSDEFTFGGHYRNSSGELFFGGVNGFNAFFPNRIERNDNVPPVVLTEIFLLDKPMSHLGPAFGVQDLDLGFRDDVVTFEFAALDFADPKRNTYAYMLEGFDEDWIDLGHHRRVTYTNLDGGRYTLRVKGANNDGVWNEEGLSLPVRVAPPPWKTWWAYIFYALAVGLALSTYAASNRRRLAREEEYSRRLENEVQERTKEVAQRNEELQQANLELREASLTDPLTGLRNRRFLFEHIHEEVSLVERRYSELAQGVERIKVFDLVFMVVDLDNFKSINDTCGHPAGDRVLLQMRELLMESCRDSDLIIRWGGDEFLLIGRDASPERGDILAKRVCSAIRDHVFDLGEGQVVKATCSVGFACFPFARGKVGDFSWEDVLALADAALYVAKGTAKDAWVGIASTEKTELDELLTRLRHEPEKLVNEGAIEVRTSLPEGSSLKWS